MLAQPVSISQQANIIALQLKSFTDIRGGKVMIVESMAKLWKCIYEVNEKDFPRLIICFNSEVAVGGYSQSNTQHRVTRSWIIAVIRGKGFKAVTGASAQLAEQTIDGGAANPAQHPTFYDDVESLRDGLRVLLNISEDFPIDYKSIKPLPSVAPSNVGNLFIDGFVIEIGTDNDIPAIQEIDLSA